VRVERSPLARPLDLCRNDGNREKKRDGQKRGQGQNEEETARTAGSNE